VLVRFPSRPVLAASVLAALAASAGTVLTMPDYAADAAEPGSDFAAAPGLGDGAPAAAPTAAGPPVSGAQIAGLALAPARDRATEVAAQQSAAAAAAAKAAAEEQARQRAAQEEDDRATPSRPGTSEWEKFRQELKEACDDGRIRGQICNGT
jgi:hypothetical protein